MPKANLPWTMVYANHDTNTIWHPVTPWFSCANWEEVHGSKELSSTTGELKACLAFQTANKVDDPDTANTLHGYISSETFTFKPAWSSLKASTEDRELIRFGWITLRTTTGTDIELARVAGQIEGRKKTYA